jgi:hypothetical protein
VVSNALLLRDGGPTAAGGNEMKMRDLKIGEVAQPLGRAAEDDEAGIIKHAARSENYYRPTVRPTYKPYASSSVHGLCASPLKDISRLLELYRNRKRTGSALKKLALERIAELDRKIAEMTAIRNAIAALSDRRDGNDRPECPILDELGSAAH